MIFALLSHLWALKETWCFAGLAYTSVQAEVQLQVWWSTRELALYSRGYGSKVNHQGTADFGPCFHLPGFHLGYLFLTHSQEGPCIHEGELVVSFSCDSFWVSDRPLICCHLFGSVGWEG